MPLAYLLTWTTYGTWLHGDNRGSVDDAHNIYDTPYAAPSPARSDARLQQMNSEALTLNTEQREVVRTTIHDHCTYRNWKLIELNVRTNHVHAIVSAPTDPETVLSQLKAWCTRKLRESKLTDQDRTVWTEGGSKRYLWDDTSLARACNYVRNEQGPDL